MTAIAVASLMYFYMLLYIIITEMTYDNPLLEINKNVSCSLISSCHKHGEHAELDYSTLLGNLPRSNIYLSSAHCGQIIV